MSIQEFRKELRRTGQRSDVILLLLDYLSIPCRHHDERTDQTLLAGIDRSMLTAAQQGGGDASLLLTALNDALICSQKDSIDPAVQVTTNLFTLTVVGLAWRKLAEKARHDQDMIGRVETTPAAGVSPLLSARELECMGLLAKGQRSSDIAGTLSISVVTVDLHLRNARRKLAALTREHAVAVAVRQGLI